MNVVANGVQLHVQRLGHTQGRSPVVVFLHGLVIDNLSSLYYSLANPVAEAGADAILYDLRGHGLSACPRSGYTIDDSVGDLLALLDALGIDEPVHLVGHSYGASIALRAGLCSPARVASLVLIEPHCSESADGGAWVEDIADLLTANALTFEHTHLAEDDSALGQRRARPFRAANDLLNGTTLVEDVSAAPAFSPGELADLAVPVLSVWGEHTDLAESAMSLAASLPGGRHEVVAGVAHSVLRDETPVVLDLLLAWLAEMCPSVGPSIDLEATG